MSPVCDDESNRALKNDDHDCRDDDYLAKKLKSRCDDSDKDDDNDAGDLCLDHTVTSHGGGRHEYNVHGDNDHDEARRVNRDSGIGHPNIVDQ